MITEELYKAASSEIEKVHRADESEDTENGATYPAEYLYGKRMLELLELVQPGSSYTLKLAAHCQHLKRWGVPRGDYSYDKRGYHQWRRAVMDFQLLQTIDLLLKSGITEADAAQVADSLRGQGDKSNPNAQIIQDTACLVFLKWYMGPFAAKHPHEKVVDILRKTMRKMSEHGLNLVAKLDLPSPVLGFITEASA